MFVNKRKFIFVFLLVALIFLSYIFMQNLSDYSTICRTGTIFVCLSILLNCLYEKKVITPSFILLLCFTLFQFGLPFLKAIDPNFNSWYINQFSESSLILSVKISVICIQFFALGLMLSTQNIKKNSKVTSVKKKQTIFDDVNSKYIYNFSKILFFITAIIAFPLAIYVMYLAFTHGYSYIKDDNMNIYNGFTRFAQQMIVPANLLLIIYSNNDRKKKNWSIIMVLYSILLLLTGARTNSLAIFLVLILLNRESKINGSSVKKIITNIITIMAGFLILFIGVFVAKYRYDGSTVDFSVIEVSESVVEEMGFNFTSLPFTKLFVPQNTKYQYGLSYVYSFICLIPRTLDPSGFIDNLHALLPETWLANSLNKRFNNLYSFGVGYSVIAEAYYNFGKFAFISIFFQGLIIGMFVNNYKDNKKFSKYIKYVMLFSLLTYPRRSLISLLKSIEYCIVLVMLLLFFYMRKRGGKEIENHSNMS